MCFIQEKKVEYFPLLQPAHMHSEAYLAFSCVPRALIEVSGSFEFTRNQESQLFS